MSRRDNHALRAYAAAMVERIDALPLIPGARYGIRPCHSLPELRQLRVELRAELKRVAGTTSYWPMCLPALVALGQCLEERRGVPIRHVRVHARVAHLRNLLAGVAKGRAFSEELEK